MRTVLCEHAGIEVPLICGAMYPCTNPELVAAVSEAGAIGIVQPISLTYVYGHDFREGLRLIRRLTPKPFGMNALIERSSKRYHEKMVRWVEIALEEGVRFFITSLGNPRWVGDRVHAARGFVYHDVTERKWAIKGRDAGVDGLIGVNHRAGGHPGPRSAQALLEEVGDLGLPVVCAGGIGDGNGFAAALRMGYAGVQMGTRFIATVECGASEAYKQAILQANAEDIVLSERITGIPVAVINTPEVQRMGLRAGRIAKWMLRGRRTKRWIRTWYALKSLHQLKRASLDRRGEHTYWQAGKSVGVIRSIERAGDVVRAGREAVRGER
ncbi:MAG: NAD(P)H-dependent flavin oxidoreductase [Gemmatimonadales bacterium]